MLLPAVFNPMGMMSIESQINEILKTNEESQKYGLVLTAENAREVIEVRNRTLQNYGRVELDIDVTRSIIECLCASPFINKDIYITVVTELQDIFYYMKNETEDKISDNRLIDMIVDFYNNSCSGSAELLKQAAETYAWNFRNGIGALDPSLNEGGEHWD
jgi:hypothetical protein